MKRLIVLRHGESEWNRANRFTGWADPSLTQTGRAEAQQAGSVIKAEGLSFDLAYTSQLKRAQETLTICLKSLGQEALKIKRTWRLNERHYGALQGLNKLEMVQRYGEAQVNIWRRSYDIPPPPVDLEDERHPVNDLSYQAVPPEYLPACESLKDTLLRLLPFWEIIKEDILSGKNLLIVAHGNSIRALYKHLFNVSKVDIVDFNIPTGIPISMELEDTLKGVSFHYLGDRKAIELAISRVANQTKSK